MYFDIVHAKVSALSFFGFLDRHEVKEKHRAKMMHWIAEVFQTYSQRTATLFKAFFIMDLYFQHANRQLKLDELHIIGATCMFIASKLEEVVPISLGVVLEQVCHGKFTE